MTARGQLEGQIGLDERSQYFQIGIVLQIRKLHSERIVRARTKIQEGGRVAWSSSCSRNAHDKNVLVRRAQLRIDQATLLKRNR